MDIGLVGKPNVGKSTLFSALTMAPAEIGNYPFTTVKPNRGVAGVRVPCPCHDFSTRCNPRNSRCDGTTRWVSVELVDVGGLVPGAHENRGIGNKFLDDLRQASVYLHVIDASGGTDAGGNVIPPGSRDPMEDVAFLPGELDAWMADVMTKGWQKVARQLEMEGDAIPERLAERVTGLGISPAQVLAGWRASGLDTRVTKWTPDDLRRLAGCIRAASKPMLLVANKWDLLPPAGEERLRAALGAGARFVAADMELALRRAAEKGVIVYHSGDGTFAHAAGQKLTGPQSAALDRMKKFLAEKGSTGVQEALEVAVFKLLDRIVVYPVEDEGKLTDKDGRVLPDAHLVPRGANAKDLAYKVHTDLGDRFIRAFNVRKKRVVGASYVLQPGDVIKIVAGG